MVTAFPAPTGAGQLAGLAEALRARVRGEVRFDRGTLAAYATDASNYRRVPLGVVLPVSVDDAHQAVAVCREHDVPVLSRGGGTSLAGQCCNTAVVLDWSKYCHRLDSVDVAARTAVVEPGIGLDALNDRLARHGLMVGPRPASHASCTLGGMIGNNSCGATAQAYGKMVDSVQRLEVLTYDGLRLWVGATDDAHYQRVLAGGGRAAEMYQRLRRLRDHHLADIRTGFPAIPRRVSGYNLDELLPERHFHLARALVGSEGTLVTVLRAEISLVPRPAATALVVLGFPDVFRAADAVPAVLPHRPVAVEGLDSRLLRLGGQLTAPVVGELPEGGGWLMVEFAGDSPDEAAQRAARLCRELRRLPAPPGAVVLDPASRDRLWRARETGLGLTAYPPEGPATHEGWEDAAVAPDRLGAYLREFAALLDGYGYGATALYGHFGQGCVHSRIPFDLASASGIATYRRFVTESAALVVAHGGSLSGEHGDGQARSELLPLMFPDRIIQAFGEVKAVFDPDDRMNPGRVVRPRRLDEDLREAPVSRPWEPRTFFAYRQHGHRFGAAAARCVGVGRCRGHGSGVMCPSYRVTGEEEHSTRGRARLLDEMLRGEVITDGWRSTAVRDALDLCLACKGCRSDCPVTVDMATYKAEFLAHHYAGRLRPRSHYSLGWVPVWARLAEAAPRAVNALTHAPGLAHLVKAAAGVAAQRTLPRFATQPFTTWFGAQGCRDVPSGPGRAEVVLWPDTFTNHFQPEVGRAAVAVLADAGFAVTVPGPSVCCGLTWISTGQLRVARQALRRALRVLRPQLRRGVPVVVLEPSCAAVFRADLPELLPDDADADRLARQTRTLAEVLRERAPDWRPAPLNRHAIAQPHCHQHAVLGFQADVALLTACGVAVDVLDAGCCGLAGNFGFEQGHYEVSMACAEDRLLPRLRQADQHDLVLADGFSCRTQIEHAGIGRTPLHLAQVLAAALAGQR